MKHIWSEIQALYGRKCILTLLFIFLFFIEQVNIDCLTMRLKPKGEAMLPLPKDCKSLEDVRNGVDALDRELVRLLVVRQEYMHAAAKVKLNRDSVYDAKRIEDVVAKVLREAKAAGLSPDIAEPVWRKLIERCIAHEFDVWDQTRT